MSAVEFDDVLLAPIYATLGVDATITLDGTDFEVVVIDKSAGVEVGGGVEVPTIIPAAAIRYSTLTDEGLSPDDLIDATISFHGFTWTIFAFKPDANPSGELSGQLLLLIKEPHELTSSSQA